MAKKLKTFTVYATVNIQCGHSIKAGSLEDAVNKSRELQETDFVEIFEEYNDGSLHIYNDGSLHITGVLEE